MTTMLTITVQPLGKTYDANQDESVLTSALEAGIQMPYGCRNGVCGACKGKLLQGEVAYDDVQPQGLTEADKANGYALFCCAKPVTDLQVECRSATVGEEQFRPKIYPVRVQSMTRLADDVMLLELKLPNQERLQFRAGQYIEFILKEGKRRAFSIANAPGESEYIQLHIRHVPQGMFTGFVFNEMQEKAILRIEAPLGGFYLREELDKPIIFVAGGTGFAPIKGIIEHMIAQGLQRPVYLYWGARAVKDLYLPKLPEAWKESFEQFHYVPVLSAQEASDHWQGRQGLVHQAVLDDFSDLSAYQVYCCGAPAMVDAARSTFIARGLDEACFFADAFTFAP